MNFKPLLALACFILSQGTILISYCIAIQFDHPLVETCNPFFQGCLNITDVGIYSPEGYVFRAGMISACTFFIMWWVVSFIEGNVCDRSWLNLASSVVGIIGSILLIIATAVLYPPRETINWNLHIACATSFFLVTFLAQFLHLASSLRTANKPYLSSLSLNLKWFSVIVQAIMLCIIIGLKLTHTGDAIGNAIEWWLALLIAIYYLSSYFDDKKAPLRTNHSIS